MKIYIAHSKQIDYINELYKPLRDDLFFEESELILPHEKSEYSSNTREFYKSIDIFIAECSEVATGLGIELGWAYDDSKNIYCIYKKGKKLSNSLKAVTNNFFEYENIADMVEIIKEIIKKENIEENDGKEK